MFKKKDAPKKSFWKKSMEEYTFTETFTTLVIEYLIRGLLHALFFYAITSVVFKDEDKNTIEK